MITSHLYKLFMKILLNRLSEKLDNHQPPNQASFHSGYSTSDHIFVVNQIIEKSKEFNKPLLMALIDYTKAFDSIEHPFLLQALKEHDIESKYVRIFKKIYENSRARIKMEIYSKWFKINRGIKQGDPFSPKSFNSALQQIFSKIDWSNKGIKIGSIELPELRFADDVDAISDDENKLTTMMNDIFTESRKGVLYPNIEKTKILTNTDIKYNGK